MPPYEQLIEPDRVSGRLYVDPDVFDDEIDRIFRQGWVFVGHESEVAEPGDFVTRELGGQPVLLSRGDDQRVRLFANRCPHRGSTVCALDRGHTRFFRCPYHGWTFDPAGTLVGVPSEDGYGPTFAREDHGLAPVPRVDDYRGFVFASWGADGPTLLDHLGSSTALIDQLCDLSPVGEVALTTGWLRHRIMANWKIVAENVCDFYHPPRTHASSPLPADFFRDASGATVHDLGDGHGRMDVAGALAQRAVRTIDEYSGLRREHLDLLAERDGPVGAVDRLRNGPPHGFVFPNLFIASQNLFVINPRAAGETMQSQIPVAYVGVPDEINRRQLRAFEGASGPAGMLEPDDSAVWERMQRGLSAGQPEWVLLERGLDRNGTEGRLLDELVMRAFWRHYLSLVAPSSPAAAAGSPRR